LSVQQPYASFIAQGLKTIEIRKWSTKYRGPIMICSTAFDFDLGNDKYLPGGCALGLVDLVDVRPLRIEDCEAAVLDEKDFVKDLYAWVLANPRQIQPIPTKGQQRLYKRSFEPVFI
jgi:hypothetical protein